MIMTLLDLSEAKANAQAEYSTLNNPQPWLYQSLLAVPSFSGKVVTPETAQRASAVLACIRILCEDISTLPKNFYKNTSKGKSLAIDEPLYSLLHDAPNDEMTSVEVWEHCILSALLYGNWYCQIVRTGGAVSAIVPLCAAHMRPRRDSLGNLVFDYTAPGVDAVTLDKSQVWRGQLLSENGIQGRAVILLAREAIGLALAAEEQGARLFSNGAQIAGLLSGAPGVTYEPEQAQKIIGNFNRAYGGSHNAMKTALLENGLTFSKVSLTAQEAQYVESRKFQLAEIARMFRIPGILLGMDDKTSTYASAEQFFNAYVKHTIMPWTVRIEQTITRDLLLPSERGTYFAKHNLGGLLRADTLQRYQAYGSGIGAGWMSANEARDLEDLNGVDGLNRYYFDLNKGYIDGDSGETVVPVQQQAALPAPEPPPQGEALTLTAVPSARLIALATAAAERVVRAESKTKKYDADFTATVMSITNAQAHDYCDKRATSQITDDSAVNALVALATEA